MESALVRRNLNGQIADRCKVWNITATFGYIPDQGGRMVWTLADGRVLTPGEFADLLHLPHLTGMADLGRGWPE